MGQQTTNQRQSWLSLVAETAGVPGATVARVEIYGDKAVGRGNGDLLAPKGWGGGSVTSEASASSEGSAASVSSVRAVIQIRDDSGALLGAASWEGSARELAEGVTVDVGCDLSAGLGTRVVGWIHSGAGPVDTARPFAPWYAASRYFDPTHAMKLMLTSPSRRPISMHRDTTQFAA